MNASASVTKALDRGPEEPSPPKTDPRDEIVEHLPSLRAFALSLCRDPTLADDLVQGTLLKAWSKFDQFVPGTNLRAWMFTILRNGFYSSQRKRSREVADSDGALTAQLAQKPDHDGHLALAELAAALGRLPVEQREALILVGAMGFSVEEAAAMCGCAEGTIKSRANRGRRSLAAMLQLAEGETTNLLPDVSDGAMSGLPTQMG
jgi:RNA polymerase sigma-70 factor (ECF subfamily)